MKVSVVQKDGEGLEALMGQRITLFCGELNGGLIAAHMSLRADEVRANIAVMTSPGYPVKIGWAKAKKDGWRVVPVQVAKLHKL